MGKKGCTGDGVIWQYTGPDTDGQWKTVPTEVLARPTEEQDVGGACEDGSDCTSSVCEEGACAEKLATGAPCTQDPECSDFLCDTDAGICKQTGKDLDASCTIGRECETGVCED